MSHKGNAKPTPLPHPQPKTDEYGALLHFHFTAVDRKGECDFIEFELDGFTKQPKSKRWMGTLFEFKINDLSFLDVTNTTKRRVFHDMLDAVAIRLAELESAGWTVYWVGSSQKVDVSSFAVNRDHIQRAL